MLLLLCYFFYCDFLVSLCQTQNKGGNAGTKKAPRRKKSSQVGKNATNISEEEVEKRLTAIQDLTYEEAIEEAIINSKITFEEEHAKQVRFEFPSKTYFNEV